MRKLIVVLVLIAFTLPALLAIARDANRDVLRTMWNEQQAQQKKEADKAKAEAAKEKADNAKKSEK